MNCIGCVASEGGKLGQSSGHLCTTDSNSGDIQEETSTMTVTVSFSNPSEGFDNAGGRDGGWWHPDIWRFSELSSHNVYLCTAVKVKQHWLWMLHKLLLPAHRPVQWKITAFLNTDSQIKHKLWPIHQQQNETFEENVFTPANIYPHHITRSWVINCWAK